MTASNIQVRYEHGEDVGAYKNNTKPRGLVFMMNFYEFTNPRYKRDGSQTDFDNSKSLFTQMGYRVTDEFCKSGRITKSQFMKDLSDFSKFNHDAYDSCIVVIMSHGCDEKIATSDDEEIHMRDVFSYFSDTSCPSLRNKPKIFILQFCRERSEVSQVISIVEAKFKEMFNDSSLSPETVDWLLMQLRQEMEGSHCTELLTQSLEGTDDRDCNQSFEQFLQVMEDRLLELSESNNPTDEHRYSGIYSIYATSPGFPSYRHRTKGTLLIQAICDVFANRAYKDPIHELGEDVSSDVENKMNQIDLAGDRPELKNGLDNKFYFNPIQIN